MCNSEQEQAVTPGEFVVKSCCRPSPDKVVFLDRADAPSIGGEIVRDAVETDFVPDPTVAFHEAGHAVVGLLFGMTPDEIVVGSGGFVRWQDDPPSREAEIVMLLAGDFAGGLAMRSEHRPIDEELAPFLALIRRPAGGFCDRCRIVRSLVSEAGIDAPDATILAAYRAAEQSTLHILHRNDVRAAIRAVADELMRVGRLSGAASIEIASRHIEPGSLNMEKSQ